MILWIISFTSTQPVGGAMTRYRYANLLAARGHEVHLLHVMVAPSPGAHPTTADIPWFDFEPAIRHHFVTERPLIDGDVVIGLNHRGGLAGASGRPCLMLQGTGDDDRWLRDSEGPVVCISRLLVEHACRLGVDPERISHIPNGIDHSVFSVTRDPGSRPLRVGLLYNDLPGKRSRLALDVLAEVRQRLPGLEVVAFGVPARPEWLEPWVEYVHRPDQEALADLYNGCRAFLATSKREGFGNTPLEAMACGAAVVTTDNGGCRDYAHDRQTALVPTDDKAAIAAAVEEVLLDDPLRAQLVANGLATALRFDWERSCDDLESLLEQYVANDSRFLFHSP